MDVNDRCGPPYTVVLDEDYLAFQPLPDLNCMTKEFEVSLYKDNH